MPDLVSSLQSTIRSLDAITQKLRDENTSLRRRVTEMAKSNLKLRAELDQLKGNQSEEN